MDLLNIMIERVTSNEPESHFDELFNWFLSLGVLDAINYIGLVSYKDISLADKIHRDNFTSSLIWEDKDLLSISRSLINKNKFKNIHKVREI